MEQESFLEQINKIISGCENELTECDTQIKHWQEKKKHIQKGMREALESIRRRCNFRRRGEEKTIGALVLGFIGQSGEARLADIKQHLLTQGRTTNPGAALTRLVKKGLLVSLQRGAYRVVEKPSSPDSAEVA